MNASLERRPLRCCSALAVALLCCTPTGAMAATRPGCAGSWLTFLGGPGTDVAGGIAVDDGGSIYLTGTSTGGWGEPVRAYTRGFDAFVAKLDAHGTLVWITFLGGDGDDYGHAIALDRSGGVYVTGASGAAWGSGPVRPFSAGLDAFVAKLDGAKGTLEWHTFLGGPRPPTEDERRAAERLGLRLPPTKGTEGRGIAVDARGSVYVAGRSDNTWGRPVRAHTGDRDAFGAKLDAKSGALVWNTFLGGKDEDTGHGIAVDGSGNLYISGTSKGTWGTPVRPYTAGRDAFAAKLNAATGELRWNTFLGGPSYDHGRGVAVDGSGNVYVTGWSGAGWGDNPVRGFTGTIDAFAAKLDATTGALAWHTFLGGKGNDAIDGIGIALDRLGNLYLAGSSDASWGSPGHGYAALDDALAAELETTTGALLWHTFLGGKKNDFAYGVAVDGGANVYLIGLSDAPWGSKPVRAHAGGEDVFVARLGAASGARGAGAGPCPAPPD
jgi:hypothetical protein